MEVTWLLLLFTAIIFWQASSVRSVVFYKFKYRLLNNVALQFLCFSTIGFHVKFLTFQKISKSQSIPSTIWYRLVAGLNAQLRLVRLGHLNKTFRPVISWLETYANPTLSPHGVRVDLSCFQPTTSGYCQFGLVMRASENEIAPSVGRPDVSLSPGRPDVSLSPGRQSR